MKIRQLHIERFGGWQQVELPLSTDGLTVLYGLNETGKSTLVRFLRGMLYGFGSEDVLGAGARPRAVACGGQLVLESDGEEVVIRRSSGTSASDAEPAGADASRVAAMLGGVGRDVYERIFAVGLAELQELATLQGDEVSQYLYQMSLGRDGQRLVTALQEADAAQRSFLDGTAPGETLRRWQSMLSDLDARIAELEGQTAQHESLERERRRLESAIDEQRARQRGLRAQLRGHRFLDRVWSPWSRQQSLLRERNTLPDVSKFPSDGVLRLRTLESELRDLRQQRIRLIASLRRLRSDLRQIPLDKPLRRRRNEVRRLLEQFDVIRARQTQLPNLRQELQGVRRRLDERLRRLGNGWSESRLESADAGPTATARLFQQAGRYRAALRARARCIRAYRRRSAAWQQRRSQLAEMLRPLGGVDVPEAKTAVRQEIAALEQLRSLQARWMAHGRLDAALRDQSPTASTQPLPAYFYQALILFVCAGAGLIGLGGTRLFNAGGAYERIVGAIFVLLGVCSGALTWTIRRHVDPSEDAAAAHERRLAEIQDERDGLEREMRRLARECSETCFDADPDLKIAGRDGVGDVFDPDELAERLETLSAQLVALEEADRQEAQLRDERGRLSHLRARIQLLQRAVSQARRDWCTALKEAGLDESVRIGASLDLWLEMQQARRELGACRAAQAALTNAECELRDFEAAVAALAIHVDDGSAGQTAERFDRWRMRLEALQAASARRAALRRDIREARCELRGLRQRRRALAAARNELLAATGANDRAGFLRLAQAAQRWEELQTLLEELTDELAQAAASEPELAVVEEDLRAFDAEQNRAAITTIEQELADLEADLNAHCERLGRVQQQIETLETDRRLAALRFDRAQAEDALDAAMREWGAMALVARGLEVVRSRLEDGAQPETLTRAARYLRQLTVRKYQRIWAPLGEKTLIVDDDRGESFRVDQLSSGSREQLFLAIRLALIDRYVAQGVELPIVLDDVFVNFDHRRTEAAVRTLIDYVADGRQLLVLTCHQHLVRLFETAGVRAIRLPDPAGETERRRVG